MRLSSELSLQPLHQRQLILSPLKSYVPSEVKLRKITRLTRSSFLPKTWKELKKPLLLKPKINLFKKRDFLRNKRMPQLPKQKQGKPKCSRWTPKELQRCSQLIFKLQKRIKLSHSCLKHKRRWMRI